MLKHKRLSIGLFVMTVLCAANMAWSQAGRELVINHFVSDPKIIEGHIVIADVGGAGSVVTLKFYDDKGNLMGNGKETLPSNGKLNLNPEKYVKGTVMTGTVHISATSNVTGQYWQFYKKATDGWRNIAVPAAAKPGYTKLVCQHFVSDPEVETYIVIADASGQGGSAYLEFYSDKGELAGQQVVNVPPNGKYSVQPYNFVGRKKMTGTAHIQTDGNLITGEYWQVTEKGKYQVAHMMQGAAPVVEEIVEEPLIRVMVNFDFDSDKIQKRSYADLSSVADAMKRTGSRYEIGGYTDDKGDDEYNRKLSERRANSVKEYLIKQGVSADKLLTVGYGEGNPLLPNTSDANRAINRRVEFKKM